MSSNNTVEIELELPEKTIRQIKELAEKYYDGDQNRCVASVTKWYMQRLQDTGVVKIKT